MTGPESMWEMCSCNVSNRCQMLFPQLIFRDCFMRIDKNFINFINNEREFIIILADVFQWPSRNTAYAGVR